MAKAKKPKLLIVSGQDRTGKDTYMEWAANNVLPEGWLLYCKDASNRPDYRDNSKWIEWLTNWQKEQKDDLVEASNEGNIKGILMGRLELDDDVYCEMFNRAPIQKQFVPEIAEKYDIEYLLFLWKDFDSYIKRLIKIGDDVTKPEYNREEFDKVKNLYLKHAKNYKVTVIEISGNETTENIHKIVTENKIKFN